MIRGERVYLKAMEPDNAEVFRAWLNDPEVNRWLLTGHVPISAQEEKEFVDAANKADDPYLFQIHVAEDDRLIGICGFTDVHPHHRRGEIGVTIGEKDAQGQGYGTDAIVTLLRLGFDNVGLHSIGISTIDGNERAEALYRKLGFAEAGRDRERFFIRGRFRDSLRFDMLADEFRARYGDDT